MNRASQSREPLRRARAARGWTQEETAGQIRRACPGDHDGPCRMTAGRYATLESGLCHPGRLHTRALCEVFGMQAAELGLDDLPDEPADRG